MGGDWMLKKSGSTFYVMGFYDLIQPGHGMVNYSIYQVFSYPKNMFSSPLMMQWSINFIGTGDDFLRQVHRFVRSNNCP